MSLYSDYVHERTDKHVYETTKGFIVYSFTEDALYIEDVYVVKQYRRQRTCFEFGDYAAGIARFKGKSKLLGSVMVNTKGASESMQMLLAYGFKLDSSTNNFILLKKELV
jgi:hypothetical protein